MLTVDKLKLPIRYAFIAFCGEGNGGTVLKVYDKVTDEVRALKILKKNQHEGKTSGDTLPEERNLFVEEFRTLAHLHHPNLVAVYDFGFLDDGAMFYTMDFIEGLSARELFGNLSFQQKVQEFSRMFIPILQAIEYVHEAGKIHGDIKSTNILFAGDAHSGYFPYIVDFGVSALAGINKGISGTLEYLAPEIIEGGTLDVQSDVYALGVLFYELLAGDVPFTGAPTAIMQGHLNVLAPQVSAANMFVLREMDEIIQRMLAKEKNRRWSSLRDIEKRYSATANIDITAVTHVHSWVPGTLIGRGSEWERLCLARSSSAETAQSLRIYGGMGTGKSRLLKEFAVDSMISGYGVIQLNISERTSVNDVFVKLLHQGSSSAARNTGDELQHDFTPHSFEEACIASAELLRGISLVSPTIIIIDDLEDAEHSLRSFIEELILRSRENSGICFVCAENAGSKIGGELFNEELHLAGLSQSGVNEILRQLIGDVSFLPLFAHRLYELTSGNPGMIIETLRILESSRQLVLERTGWEIQTAIDTLQIPRDIGASLVESFVRRGLLNTQESRGIATVLAVASAALEADAISGILSISKLVCSPTLSRLSSIGFLRETVDDEIFRYEYGNTAAKNAFLQTVPSEEIHHVHRIIAAYWRGHGFSEKYFAEHLYRGEDYAAAVPASERAGDIYYSEYSYRNASQSFHHAIDSLQRFSEDISPMLPALYLKLADAAGMDGDKAAEGEAIQEAVVHAARENDKKMGAQAYVREAQYYNATGDFERAARSAEKGIAAAGEAQDGILLARSQAASAISFQRRGAIREFLSRAREAVESFRNAGLPEDAAGVLLDIGFAHALFLNEPSLALQEYEEAKSIYEKEGAQRGIARAIGSIGLAHYWLGRHAESLASLETARGLFARLHDMRGEMNALTNIARVQLVLKKYTQAIETSQTAISVAKKIRDRFSEQKLLETLGSVYERLGVYERAFEVVTRANALAEAIGNRAALASSLQLMGRVMILRNQFERADEYLRRASEIADEVNETDARISVSLWRSELCLRQPMPDPALARKYLDETERMGESGAKKGREATMLVQRVEIALLENNMAEARRHITEALRLTNESNDSEEAAQNVWLYHFKVFERSGDYVTAKQSLERAYSILKSEADAIHDGTFRGSFLENVRDNKDIVESYRRINREPLNAIPATNELMLRRLYGVSAALNSMLDSEQVLNRLIDGVIEVLQAERGLIFLYEKKDESFHVAVARNVDKTTIEDASKISESILKDVFRRGKPVITLNAGSDDRFRDRPSVVNLRLTAVYCVPLILRDSIIGTVYVDSSNVSHVMDDNATTVEFLEAFANLAAVAVENARLHERLREENVYLRKEVEGRYAFENIIGGAPAMKRVYELMRGAMRGDSPVLLEGESGTGKELIARAVHFNGKRKANKFVAIDCGALPETLLDSELFGHKKGAFTGATEEKIGLFEEANDGTIFLDEITNTSPLFQAKLLRVVQEREVRRVGDTMSRTVNVRIITATNRALQDEVREGRFREDLYYRLNVIPIRIPPLRERRDDIPFLAQHFIKRFSESLQSPVRNAGVDLMNVFLRAEWRGNVRELENTIHRMMVYATSGVLSVNDLPADFAYAVDAPKNVSGELQNNVYHVRSTNANATLEQMLRDHIASVLRSAGGNKTEAAKILGVKRTTLIQKMKKLKMM